MGSGFSRLFFAVTMLARRVLQIVPSYSSQGLFMFHRSTDVG